MKESTTSPYAWAIVGAGPAGIASVGLLLDAGIQPETILWIDPDFQVGDFGALWGEVSSNTSVKLFLDFLNNIKAFEYSQRPSIFSLEALPPNGFSPLKSVAEPLQWVTDHLRKKVTSIQGKVTKQTAKNHAWHLTIGEATYAAEKVILATGAAPKSLPLSLGKEITLSQALNPEKLASSIKRSDTVAVFGASHSAMIIIRNLLEAGAKQVNNFYLHPIRYAISMGDWTLYDNTGLKGETAKWVKQNLGSQLHPKVQRFISTKENIDKYTTASDKVIYATGFTQRAPWCDDIDLQQYDTSCGIIAPGLFGAGIGFPIKVTDPNGNQALNVGLWKFMNDIRRMLPIWQKYSL